MAPGIPPDLLERVPLCRPEWVPTYLRLIEHDDAPKWNTRVGDRLEAADLDAVGKFADRLNTQRRKVSGPSLELPAWIEERARYSQHFRERLESAAESVRARDGRAFDLVRDFSDIAPMEREDLALRLERVVPTDMDAEFSRIVVNPTSGTTGHPIPAPNHPRAVGCYDVFVKFILEKHGARVDYDHRNVAALQLCAQRETTTYATVHAAANGAGFAKINIEAHAWREPGAPGRYIEAMEPFFLTGDPYAFAVMMRRKLITPSSYRPGALISTALGLHAGLRSELAADLGCPVIDVYSLNETGPLACAVPPKDRTATGTDATEFVQLPHDVYIEAVDPETGRPVPEGEVGELLVSGGRNPFLPLLRYRTGDFGRIVYNHNGTDPMPRLFLEHARRLVLFEDISGESVNPIDIARILRRYPIVQHRFVQRADRSCDLELRIHGEEDYFARSYEAEILGRIGELFTAGGSAKLPIRVRYGIDEADVTAAGKIAAPFVKE